MRCQNRQTGYKHPNSETNSRFLGSQTSYKDVSLHLDAEFSLDQSADKQFYSSFMNTAYIFGR